MQQIESLIDFLRIVCENRKKDDQSNSLFNNLNQSDSTIDEYLSLVRENKVNNDQLDCFVNQNKESLYSFYEKIKSKEETLKKQSNQFSYFYRGVNSNIFPIAPGIYRKDEIHTEDFYFNEMNVRCPSAFHSLSNLEKLTYMQHYECPTRLLDITSNPLVALYFACFENNLCENENCKNSGVVYVFSVNNNDVLYSRSDKIQMLSSFPELKEEDRILLQKIAYRNIHNSKFPESTNSKYKDPVVERYYHIIKRNNVAFDRSIVPIDILKPQFVRPNKDNPRILKQDGAFIISGLDTNEKESDMKIRKYLVDEIEVPYNRKKYILNELEYVGINQATLFPEVDRVAGYLKKHN